MKNTQNTGTTATEHYRKMTGCESLSPEGRKKVTELFDRMEADALAQRKKSQASTSQKTG